jgi:hypothetical protein
MIGILLIYFVGKSFYDLAALHNKSQWGFAVLGVVSYYAGNVLGGVLLAILSELGLFSLEGIHDMVIGIMALPIGILACWGTYSLLRKRWEKSADKVNGEEVLDGDFIR